jgi:hypothetical protein
VSNGSASAAPLESTRKCLPIFKSAPYPYLLMSVAVLNFLTLARR